MKTFRTEKAFSKWIQDTQFPLIPKLYKLKPFTGPRRGVLDLYLCINGYFIALELKLDTAAPDPGREKLQEYECEKIRKAGGFALERVTPLNWAETFERLLWFSRKR